MEIWHKWLFPQGWMVSGVYEHTPLLMSICLYEKERRPIFNDLGQQGGSMSGGKTLVESAF